MLEKKTTLATPEAVPAGESKPLPMPPDACTYIRNDDGSLTRVDAPTIIPGHPDFTPPTE